MREERISEFILGLILLLAILAQAPELKFLLPDFVIEDEMIALQGFYQLASGNFQGTAFYKYPGLIILILALLIYPANLVYNFRALIHLETFSDFKILLAHPRLSPESIFYLGRWTSLAAGVLSVWLFYLLFRRRIGNRPALIGCVFLAFSPAWLFSSSVFKNDSFLLLSLMLLLIGAFGILDQGRNKDYLLAGLGLGLCLAAKFHFFALIPLIYAHRLRQSSLGFGKALFRKELFFSLAPGLIIFFLFSPLQFFRPLNAFSNLGLELAIQSHGHPLLKASFQHWYYWPVLFQLICVFPFALGIPGYLLSISGFRLAAKTLGKPGFRLFLSYPLGFFLGWAVISRLGYPHLYLPLTPFFALPAGLAIDRMLKKKFFYQLGGIILFVGSMVFNLAGFREFNEVQTRIIYQGLDSLKDLSIGKEKTVAFFPYRPLAGSGYLSEFQFEPQFLLTEKWLAQNHPDKVLVHQTSYLAYLDNPELNSPAREGFFLLSQGKLNYRLEREWKAELRAAKIYAYFFPDLNYFSVALYQKK